MTPATRTIRLPLSPFLHEDGSVSRELEKPGVHNHTAAHPILLTKCINCNKESTLRCQRCKEAVYCSKACESHDAELHARLCKYSSRFRIEDDDLDVASQDRFRVLILHAEKNKVEFAWAVKKQECLEVKHTTISDFKSRLQLDYSTGDDTRDDDAKAGASIEYGSPKLLNMHMREFSLARYLGHCLLLWSTCGWRELPIEWVNQTALSLGSKVGQTNLFYGPLIVTVFKQDIVDLRKRTLDHVRMHTLRQVVDYIQMAADNPCVPNPERFILSDGPSPICGVKVNSSVERRLLGSCGTCDVMDEVYVSPRCPRAHLQWPAAIPFVLGLRWVVRTAQLDVVTKQPTKFVADDLDLGLLRWQLSLASFNTRPGLVEHNRTNCSLVVFQANGGPLASVHVKALLEYVTFESRTKGRWLDNISRVRFEEFWNEHYAHEGVFPSPYDLETASASNSTGTSTYDGASKLVERDQWSLLRSLQKAPFEPWAVLKGLSEMCLLDEEVLEVWKCLKELSRTNVAGEKDGSAASLRSTSPEQTTDDVFDASRTAKEVASILSDAQLSRCVNYFEDEPRDALMKIRKGVFVLDREPFLWERLPR